MSHIPLPVLDQTEIDKYMRLFRGDTTVQQPEKATYEYVLAMLNLWRLDESTHNVSVLAIERMDKAVLDFFTHGHFNSGLFAFGEESPLDISDIHAELVGVPAFESF
jgi:hypothetical protein